MQVKLRDGRTAEIRDLRENEDVFQFCEFINAIIDEDLYLCVNEKQTPETQADWMRGRIKAISEGKGIHLVVECDGKICGSAEANKGRGREKHIVLIGFTLSKSVRNQGLGTQLIKETIRRAKQDLEPEIIYLQVPHGNPAKRLYERIGFKQVATLPGFVKFRGKNIDKYVMVLQND